MNNYIEKIKEITGKITRDLQLSEEQLKQLSELKAEIIEDMKKPSNSRSDLKSLGDIKQAIEDISDSQKNKKEVGVTGPGL